MLCIGRKKAFTLTFPGYGRAGRRTLDRGIGDSLASMNRLDCSDHIEG